MLQGRVIKAYNSFFYVQLPGRPDVLSCRLRGRFKKARRTLAVVPGDCVSLSLLEDGTGVIEEIQPRRQLLQHPAVANLTQVMLTFAAAQPELHPLLLNRFLVMAEWSGVEKICICLNKLDLRADADAMLSLYEAIGYPVLRVAAQTGEGLDALKSHLAGEITVFAGPSGVGKSSLLNALEEGLMLTTGQVSEKIKRGRHTTRVAELLPYSGGGYIVDTPGFSAVELTELELAELPRLFPEFRPCLGSCRFKPCSHTHEPGCAVKEAVQAGSISGERYEAYTSIRGEAEASRQLAKKKEYR